MNLNTPVDPIAVPAASKPGSLTRLLDEPHPAPLLMGGLLTVAATVVMAPGMLKIQAAFADVPNIALLVPLALTIPSLLIAFVAPLVGVLADRHGRKPFLITSTVAYALLGTAPLWLDSWQAVLASRVLLGICEAAVMTCCTALIGDYYRPPLRQRYFGYQMGVLALSSVALSAVAGALADRHWRAPFAMYGLALLLLPFFLRLREPQRSSGSATTPAVAFPWSSVLPIYAFGLVGMLSFYLTPIHLPSLYAALGIGAATTVGLTQALGAAAGGAAGLVLARAAAKSGASATNVVPRAAPSSFFIQALGYACVGAMTLLAPGSPVAVPLLVSGVLISSFGGGLMVPTLSLWLMQSLPDAQRARGTGFFLGATFLGQFLCPLLTIPMAGALGSNAAAVGAAAVAMLALTPLVRLFAARPAALQMRSSS